MEVKGGVLALGLQPGLFELVRPTHTACLSIWTVWGLFSIAELITLGSGFQGETVTKSSPKESFLQEPCLSGEG